jgi:hypothetical protein
LVGTLRSQNKKSHYFQNTKDLDRKNENFYTKLIFDKINFLILGLI